MDEVSLIISAKVSGTKTSTTTITNVNPTATNEQLYELGVAFASFIMAVSTPIITRRAENILDNFND